MFDLASAIVDVHDSIVVDKGFNPELSDEQRDNEVGMVQSVVSSVFCTFFGLHPEDRYDDVFIQIAEFAAHLSKGHIFYDGNKRTTVVASIAILYLAGYTLDIDDSENAEDNILYQWIQDIGLFGGFCGRDSGIGPAQRAKTTIWN